MSQFYRFTRHPLAKILLVWGLALVYVLYLVGFAHVSLPTPTASIAITTHTLNTSSSAELQYWTPNLMRSAIDDDQFVDKSAEPGSQNNNQGQSTSQEPQQGQGVPPGKGNTSLYPLSTTGKVFFTSEGVDYVCSGAAIVSTNRNTVNTAGHCLYWERSWSENVLFCPLYGYGEGPYGCWPARELAVPSDWISASDYHHDMGMAVMTATTKGNLTDMVGGAGWAYNQPDSQQFYAYGYPANEPFDGESLQSCQGEGKTQQEGNGWVVSIPCNMTGGSSGGPWFIKNGEQWFINGHVDFGYIGLPGVLFSPFYDDTWYALYEQAQQM